MKKVLSIALALAIAATTLVSCTSKPASTPSSSKPSSTSTSTPTKDVEQTMYISTVAGEFNFDRVQIAWGNPGGMILPNMFRPLVLADHTFTKVSPDLASDWKMSDDKLTYTFTLKDGLKWSDGEAITVDDVAFSVQTVLKAAGVNANFVTAFSTIEGAAEYKDGKADKISGITTDGNTVTMKLTKPFGNFINVVAQFYILPEHALNKADPNKFSSDPYWVNPVTSGRYMVSELVPSNYFTLSLNPNYEGTAPKITKIVQYYAADYIIAAQEGKQDFFNSNATDQIAALKGMDHMKMVPVNIMFYRYFVSNIAGIDGNVNKAMQDVRVRQAIMHAIDRATVASGIFPDLANIIDSGDVTNTMGTKFDFDAEKAKQLLKDAGWDPNYTLRIMMYYADQASKDFMDAVIHYLGQVGVKAEYVISTNATADLYQTRNYDIAYKGLSAFNVNEWYGEYSSTSQNFNKIFNGDTAFDFLITELLQESDPAKLTKIQEDLVKIENEKLYKLPLFSMNNSVFVNSKRLSIPESVQFGNPWYNYDCNFEEWSIIG